MTLIFYSNQTDLEKGWKKYFSRMSVNIPMNQKMLLWRSVTFCQKNNSMNFFGGSKY